MSVEEFACSRYLQREDLDWVLHAMEKFGKELEMCHLLVHGQGSEIVGELVYENKETLRSLQRMALDRDMLEECLREGWAIETRLNGGTTNASRKRKMLLEVDLRLAQALQLMFKVCNAHCELVDRVAVYRDRRQVELDAYAPALRPDDEDLLELNSDEEEELENAVDKMQEFCDTAESIDELYEWKEAFDKQDVIEFREAIADVLLQKGIPLFEYNQEL